MGKVRIAWWRLALILSILAVLVCVLATGSAQSAIAPENQLTDPKLEERARALGRGLRCLVCRNQSIEESDADLAGDMRIFVRRRLREGADEDQIQAEIVARFGQFVLLRPDLNQATLPLWLAPFATLGLGCAIFALWIRRRKKWSGR